MSVREMEGKGETRSALRGNVAECAGMRTARTTPKPQKTSCYVAVVPDIWLEATLTVVLLRLCTVGTAVTNRQRTKLYSRHLE